MSCLPRPSRRIFLKSQPIPIRIRIAHITSHQHHAALTSPTTLSFPPPNLATVPRFNRICRSITSSLSPCRSRIASTRLMLTASRNSRPAWDVRPRDSASRSAACVRVERAERVRRAGLSARLGGCWLGWGCDFDWGCCDCADAWEEAEGDVVVVVVAVVVVSLAVLECESVGLGTTGPMERREAAK